MPSYVDFFCLGCQFVLQQHDNPLSKKLNEVVNEIRRQRCSYLRYDVIVFLPVFLIMHFIETCCQHFQTLSLIVSSFLFAIAVLSCARKGNHQVNSRNCFMFFFLVLMYTPIWYIDEGREVKCSFWQALEITFRVEYYSCIIRIFFVILVYLQRSKLCFPSIDYLVVN